MSKRKIFLLLSTALLLCTLSAVAGAQISAQPTTNLPSSMPTETNRPVTISGQVALDDGTPLAEPVEVQRVCGNIVRGEVYSDSKGRFTILLDDKSIPAFQSASEGGGATQLGADMGGRLSQTTRTQLWNCEIRALLPGYSAGAVSLAGRDFSMPVSLGTLALHRIGNGVGRSISATTIQAPADARKEFDKGRDDFAKKKLEDADKHLAKAIEIYPQYAAALDLRGRVQRARRMDEDAAKSFQAAIAADEKYLPPYLHLGALEAARANWAEVVRLSNKAIQLDPLGYPDPYYFNTVALLKLNELPEAKQNLTKVLELDKDHRFPRAELIIGNILRGQGDIPGSTEHYRKYVQLEPNGPEVPNIRAYLAQLDQTNVKPATPKPN